MEFFWWRELQNLQFKFIMYDYYFINKLFFSQSSVYDEIQRITDYASTFPRDRIRSYTKEGNTLYYFFGFCYFLEQGFIVVLKMFYHITKGKVNLIQTVKMQQLDQSGEITTAFF